MKKLLYGIALFVFCSFAQADYEPVSDNTPLFDLPEDAQVLVKQDMSYNNSNTSNNFYVTKFGEGVIYYYKDRKFNYLTRGELFRVKEVRGPQPCQININFDDSGSICFGYQIIRGDQGSAFTVADFNRFLGDYFQIVYNSNYTRYPGIEKTTVVDIVMGKIVTSLKNSDYKNSLKDFTYLEKSGAALPESFYYYYADALDKSGKKVEARAHASDYLKKFGKGGKYYAQVIEIMSHL